MVVEFVSLILAAYLLGSIPAAYLTAKRSCGIDLRQYGSGNVGATNLLSLTSRRVALPVIIFDLAKGMVMVCVAYLLGLDLTQQLVVGLATIIGHNWSVFLRFSGGRGVLTTIGVGSILPIINGIYPWAMGIFAIISIAGVFLHYTPVMVLIGLVVVPLVSWGVGDPPSLIIGYLALFLLVVIRRLALRRADIAASISKRELLFNRLFFDRDIRDREAWIKRFPVDLVK